jgi:signal transduction histidine kinase/CheY-like chemotaxis protein
MDQTILTVSITHEQDVVLCRQRARQIAALLGFDLQGQTRIATAVSEIARNAFRYASGGKATFAVTDAKEPAFHIRIQDRGPGIPHLEEILGNRYDSKTGMGLGIIGARRLMDSFQIESSANGTMVVLGKRIFFREDPLSPREMMQLTSELAKSAPQDAYSELRQQNAELAQAMRTLQDREEELTRQRNQLGFLNEELADTNRGVVALNKELEEKADAIRQAGEIKSRFLSHMTHEFRTPLNSILSLSRILLSPSETDPLSPERQKQITFIRRSAEQLSDMINDMLDTAKLEAGRLEVQAGDVDVAELFGSLRAMFRPLLGPEPPVELLFEMEESLPELHSDEGKIAQILRNFISNALKFTVKGEVQVKARLADPATIEFSVADSGIGIPVKDQERIFEEFTQLDNPLQRRSKGTGLGLPLARRLAELLHGSVSVTSEPGIGSTFKVILPLKYLASASHNEAIRQGQGSRPAQRLPLPGLPFDNKDQESNAGTYIERENFHIIATRSLVRARQALQNVGARQQEGSVSYPDWPFMMDIEPGLSSDRAPIIRISLLSDAGAKRSHAERLAVSPSDQLWFLNRLHESVSGQVLPRRILIIDDDEVARYLLMELLKDSSCTVLEATGGEEGLRRAREDQPQVIFLDLRMHDMSGFEVLEALKNSPATWDIPIIINSSLRVQMSDFEKQDARPMTILYKEWPQEESKARIKDALCQAGLIGLELTGEQ